MKTKVLTAGLIVILGTVFALMVLNRRPAQEVASLKAQPVAPPPGRRAEELALPPQPAQAVEPAPPPVESKLTPHPASIRSQPPPIPPGQQVVDPDARAALALVGEDPDAEAYWENAIFDPTLPDKERDDLMEDLNEVGFADPEQPGQQDLPLILNRLAIIEQIAPYTDDFMARHLGEAYKDLLQMANKVSQGQ